MTTDQTTADLVVTGREPTAEEIDLLSWGEKAARKTLPFLNETLARLVVLNSALLGGSLFIDKNSLPGACRALAVVLLLGSLGASLLGTLPYGATVSPQRIEQVRRVRDAGLRLKDLSLKAAACCLFAAFLVAVVGVAAKAIWG
jgi:hypothetical protein